MACVPATASAQTLARLHVTSLSLASDRARVAVRAPFHVTIHLHVLEHIAEPDNLFLPDLTNCEIEGTERRTVASASGTDYRETLTLEALEPGRAHLTPARLLAIDARNGMPSQFASNDLTIMVGPPSDTLTSVARAIREALRVTLSAGLLALVILIGVVIAIVWVRRARAPAVPLPSPVAAPPPPRPGRRSEELRDALAQLDGDRSPASALRVRRALFVVAGAPPEATLRDVLGTVGEGDPALRSAVVAAERASFRDGPYRPAAIDELLRTGDTVAGALERAG